MKAGSYLQSGSKQFTGRPVTVYGNGAYECSSHTEIHMRTAVGKRTSINTRSPTHYQTH